MNYLEMTMDEYKNVFRPDLKIRIIKMIDDLPSKYHVPPYTVGKVTYVDDAKNVHMAWENGSSLNLLPDVDLFEFVED